MAEIKNLDAVASLEAMDAHVDDWRDATKGKQRGIFSFDDLVTVKLKTLKKRIYTDIESIPPWKMKECIYKGIDDYEFFYDDWKELNVGVKQIIAHGKQSHGTVHCACVDIYIAHFTGEILCHSALAARRMTVDSHDYLLHFSEFKNVIIDFLCNGLLSIGIDWDCIRD